MKQEPVPVFPGQYRTEYVEYSDKANRCIDAPYFSVRVVNVEGPFHRNLLKYDSFVITMCIQGDCTLRIRNNGDSGQGGSDCPREVLLREGWSCLIPAAIADYDIIPMSGHAQLLDAFIDNKDRSVLNRLSRFLHITKR